VDQPNDRIMEWSADGKLSTFMQPSVTPTECMFDANGNLIACADEHNQLWSIAPDKTVTVLITNYQGKYHKRPQRRLGRAQRLNVHHRPVLQAHLVGPFTMALTNQEVFYLSPDRKTSRK
jgi:gluconolactonase